MGRAPCCEKDSVKRGPWTPEEDAKLLACIAQHGTGSWRTLPKKAGLQRCGKSCRLRWTNYLRPDLKHGRFTDHEEQLIVNLHAALGSRWSLIAAQLPGRTDNDVKNYWNTRLKKKLCEMGIDPITHKPISQLLADLASSMALPKGGEIAEAALGCFKDDMLNVLMRKRPDWQLDGSNVALSNTTHGFSVGRQSWDMIGSPRSCVSQPRSVISSAYNPSVYDRSNPTVTNQNLRVDAAVQKIKYSLSRAVQTKEMQRVGDAVMPREDSMSRNMAVINGRFYRGECGIPGATSGGANCSIQNVHFPCMAQTPYIPTDLMCDQQETSSRSNCTENQCANTHVPTSCEMEPWSPSPSGSSCSNSSLVKGDVAGLEKVLNSDVFLWDFSELGSIMS
ncbi:uncharacterized protein [Physcomitrium patens]|uniref:Uncharacterized protein n=1 Tax=Physcomitrium patens TaxID=3218 RepID=A0A2K1JHJ1_PHYPA|nr:uncharacterized protein LOC112291924 [Physcomitrium patens]PNR41018.1 hypothetical protein PHYPA_018421 [Physcomitrium patens]|eukprot:XP_024395700.1 uncharacterized protein LOC112291924 [Physcomitrella patens]